MKKYIFASLTRLLGTIFLWISLGHAPDLHAQTRKPALDFTLDVINASPQGIWSNNTTMWVANFEDGEIYAYTLATEARDASRDFNTLIVAGNTKPTGIWSDGTTMWVAEFENNKLHAYILATMVRDMSKDLETPRTAGNFNPLGIWSDGTTIWVVDDDQSKLYAYTLATMVWDKDKDLTLDSENSHARGIWSDGTTMWVSDEDDEKLYAYTLATKARNEYKDFNTLMAAGNTNPQGIWSDDTTMWVADGVKGKLYAYALKKDQTITFTLPSTGMAGDTLDLSATTSSTLEVTYVSSDPSIAEVGTGMNANKLILKAGGNATITANQAGDAQYLAATDVSHTITVSKKDQTITFTLPSTGMAGDTLDLSATTSSTLEVTYSSSNSTIAEVGTGTEEGKLILKAGGNATITASQAGNAQYLEATEVTQSITVNDVVKNSQTITFTLPSTGMAGDTLDLSATASSTLEVSYSSSNTTIAEVGTEMNAGKLILKAMGTATITASQAGNAQYNAAGVTRSITVNEEGVLSVDVKNTDIQVWPNPVTTQLNISSGRRTKITIVLSNLAGQRLQERELKGEGQIDVSHVPAGVYLLYIRTAEETTSYLVYKE